MRKKIAAANWKMNLTWQEGVQLLETISNNNPVVSAEKQILIAVPFPYLTEAVTKVKGKEGIAIAAQNCHHKESGAYTGEVSASMLASIGISYCIIGHSERREYQAETNEQLAQKMKLCFQQGITPIFCCGEPLLIREAEQQNDFVKKQLEESLFQLEAAQVVNVIVAYEPIWAIGTGRTASAEQAQEMHAHLRAVIAGRYGQEVADSVSILYGGSVKGANAQEIFSGNDVDGGLVGGASLVASEFQSIINAL
jgi:triosephosphate isomerase